MTTEKQSIFEQLNSISVKGKTEKKGQFTYLSWAFAWAELMKAAPSATIKVYEDEKTSMPYFSSSAGVLIKVGVSVDYGIEMTSITGNIITEENIIERICYLPVMDFKNQAKKLEDVNMMDINKTIQRATVKAIALHGLGLYIYAGEDLPEEEKESIENKPSGQIMGHQGGKDFDDKASEKQVKMLMWLLNEKYNKSIPADILKAVGFINKSKASEKIEALKKELNK